MAVLRNNPGNIEVLNMNRSLLDQDKNLTAATKKDLKNLKDKEMPSGFFYKNSRASQWAGMNDMYALHRKDEKGKKPFASFEHKMWGIRAMFKVLQGSGYFQLIDGEIRNEKMKQSVNVFNKYAPSTENSVSDYNGRVTGMLQGQTYLGLDKAFSNYEQYTESDKRVNDQDTVRFNRKFISDQKIAKQYNITIPDGFDQNNIKPQDIPYFVKAMVVMENGTKNFINNAGKKERFVDYYLGDEEVFKMAEWAAQRDYSEDETYESVKAGYEHYLKNKDLLVHELGD